MQWLLTRKVWLLNTRKVHLAHFLKKVDIVRFNSKPSICFTNEIRGGGVIDTLYMQNERGWADMRLSMVGGGGWVWGGGFAPLENEKRKGEYRPQSAVGGK